MAKVSCVRHDAHHAAWLRSNPSDATQNLRELGAAAQTLRRDTGKAGQKAW